MMRTLAEFATDFLRKVEDIRADPSILRRRELLAVTQIFANSTHRVVQNTEALEDAAVDMIAAVRIYTDSRRLDLLAPPDAEHDARLFGKFEAHYRKYIRVLGTAHPASQAKRMGIPIDITDVAPPEF